MEHPSEHIEHIEHQQHAAHSPFDRRVAMTMAIVASVLACVTMLSHRAHNDTLRLQAEANGRQTEAAIASTESDTFHTEAFNQWAFYQAKKGRSSQDDANLEILRLAPVDTAKEKDRQEIGQKWKDRSERYKKDIVGIEAKAREYAKQADEKHELARKKQEEVPELIHQSHAAHEKGTRFDISELAVELSLVLCSIAILTKQRGFWFAGIVSGLAGLAAAASVLFLHGGGH